MEEELDELRATLAQVHQDSREIEQELEAEILARENACNQLEEQLEAALSDAEKWKAQCSSLTRHNEGLELELRTSQREIERINTRLHTLESENDNMELNSRVYQGSVESLQAENQRLLEALALKDVDAAYNQKLEEELQHTRDELAEAQEEIANLQRKAVPPKKSYAHSEARPHKRTPSLCRMADVIDTVGGLHDKVSRFSNTHTSSTADAPPIPLLNPSEKGRNQCHASSTAAQHIPPQLGGSLHPTKLRSHEWVLMDVKPSKVNTAALKPLCDGGKISQGRGHGLANR